MKIKRQPGMGKEPIPRSSSGFYVTINDDYFILRKRPTQPYKRDRCSEFYRQQLRFAALSMAWQIPIQIEGAIRWSAKGNDTWKDTLTRAMFGTLYYVRLEDGTEYHPANHTCPAIVEPEEEEMPFTVRHEWSHAVSGNTLNVDYAIEDDVNELLAIIDGVTTAGNAIIRVLVSTDNGATYPAALGDWLALQFTGLPANTQGSYFSTTATTAARSGVQWLPTLRLGNRRIFGLSPFNSQQGSLFVKNNDPATHIRVSAVTQNMTGGKITILGK